MFAPVTDAPYSLKYDSTKHVQGGVGAHELVAAIPVDRAGHFYAGFGKVVALNRVQHAATALADIRDLPGASVRLDFPVSLGWPPPVG